MTCIYRSACFHIHIVVPVNVMLTFLGNLQEGAKSASLIGESMELTKSDTSVTLAMT